MNKKITGAIIAVLSLLCIGLGIWVYKLIRSTNTTVEIRNRRTIEVLTKVDTINVVVDSIKTVNDTIQIYIDKYKDKLIYINKEYEKDFNVILTQPVDSDCKFFTDYLSKNSTRFTSSDTTESAQTDESNIP